MPVRHALRKAYELMHVHHGHLGWWPGETPFEVAVGAILTQNTAWTNVEQAIANLKRADVLTPRKLFGLPEKELARLIRPAGYFNVKARRLRNFLRVLVGDFGASLDELLTGDTADVRARLLAINGIGRETADSILLYAGTHHSFVIDAYTKRIFERHGWWREEPRAKHSTSNAQRSTSKGNTPETYEALKALCETSLDYRPPAGRLDYWRDYHAQLVMIGKSFCRPREPRCEACPLCSLLDRHASPAPASRSTERAAAGVQPGASTTAMSAWLDAASAPATSATTTVRHSDRTRTSSPKMRNSDQKVQSQKMRSGIAKL